MSNSSLDFVLLYWSLFTFRQTTFTVFLDTVTDELFSLKQVLYSTCFNLYVKLTWLTFHMNKICWEFITEFSTIPYRIYFYSKLFCEIYILKFQIRISFQGDFTFPLTWKIFYEAVILLCSNGLFTANVIYCQLQTFCTISTFHGIIDTTIHSFCGKSLLIWMAVSRVSESQAGFFLKTNIIMSESCWGTINV